MASDTAHRDPEPEHAGTDQRPGRIARVRRVLGALWNHLFRIRYRLLLINLIVVAVPIVGIGFARTFETEMLASLESDMIHQAQLLRETLIADPSGLRLDERSPMLERAARHTRTRIRLIDERGLVRADSHGRGPPEGAEKPVPGFLGTGSDSYHPPEVPELVDISSRREVERALAGRYGSATRLWENRGRVYLFSALPIVGPDTGGTADTADTGDTAETGDAVRGVVYVTRSTAPVKLAMLRLRNWLFLVLVLAIASTAILTLFLAATIARPLGRLTRIAQRIASGGRREPLALERRDEIGDLARAIDTMTRRLDERARYVGELAANISHEFKSPLTSIRGAAELLMEGAADDPPARERFLSNILEDTHRLDRLVTRLLELSRFEADDTPVEIFDYHALVREVVAARRETTDTEIELVYRAASSQISGRRAHLASALGNLLDNALAFAEPGTPVEVRVTDGPRGGATVRTAIKNRGPALSDAALERVWQRFYTTRAKQGGTGLGLSIVASIVTAHGGQTSALSTERDGTIFSYDLPA